MDRKTRYTLLKIKKKLKTLVLLFTLSIPVGYLFFGGYKEVEVFSEELRCDRNVCLVLLSIKNHTIYEQRGKVKVNFIIKKGASPVGGNSGYVMENFGSIYIEYSLRSKETSDISAPYTLHKKPDIMTTIVLPY